MQLIEILQRESAKVNAGKSTKIMQLNLLRCRVLRLCEKMQANEAPRANSCYHCGLSSWQITGAQISCGYFELSAAITTKT
ncbi:uncharacterized protein LOC108605193 isoform X3 [Drosophila busckii]|uniref:uncharacterized protein LOC108605193 isoform X3 n=1 Tax=Drosophila busckii TaxID=30019 RepID=UPI00083EF4BB|nr:uncharacterized protein LOC108605193 isoform X3 [Drosophila busckii]